MFRILKKLYQQITNYLRTKLKRVQYVIFIAVLTGLTAGLLAVLLKSTVHYLQHWIDKEHAGKPLYYLFPVIGLLITVLITRQFFRNSLEKGIAMVLRAIARRSSYIPFSHTYAHVMTSSLTVGLGGSAGLEAPIVATGSAAGSNLARISDMNYPERTLLIACGAAAGIAAVFNAPIAGVIFAIEVLLTETVLSYFIPLIISSVTGALCSRIILEESSLFNFVLKQNFDYRNVPFYILLGVLAGFISLYYARSFKKTERLIHRWKANAYVKALAGGLLLALLFFVLPPLFGEGYSSVRRVANGAFVPESGIHASFLDFSSAGVVLLFLAGIVLLKPLAAGITLGAGGNGGNFAPSLFTGAYLGFFFQD